MLRLTDALSLRDLLVRYPRRAGTPAIAAALAARAAGATVTRSELEERFLDLLERHGLSRPQHQHLHRRDRGGLRLAGAAARSSSSTDTPPTARARRSSATASVTGCSRRRLARDPGHLAAGVSRPRCRGRGPEDAAGGVSRRYRLPRHARAHRPLDARRPLARQPRGARAARRHRQLVRAPPGQALRRRARDIRDGLELRSRLRQQAHASTSSCASTRTSTRCRCSCSARTPT